MSFAQILYYECVENLLLIAHFFITFTGNLDILYYNCILLSK